MDKRQTMICQTLCRKQRRSSNIYPNKNRSWTRVLRKG